MSWLRDRRLERRGEILFLRERVTCHSVYSCNLKCSLQGHWRSGKGWKAASPVVISYCRMKIMNPAMLVESVVRQCCRLGQHNHIITAALPTSLPAFPLLISITCLWNRQGRSAPTKKNCKQEKSPVQGHQAAK